MQPMVNVAPKHMTDLQRMHAIEAYENFLHAMQIPITPDTEATPRRVVDAYIELLHDEPWNCTTFQAYNGEPGEIGDYGMVVMKDIPFVSLCAHHVLPFIGHAHIAYLPDRQLLGLSKFARAVKSYSKGLQTQEVIGRNIADFLQAYVKPLGCMVVLEAEHTCMAIRGVKAVGTTTTTSAVRGVFFNDARVREEALVLLRLGR